MNRPAPGKFFFTRQPNWRVNLRYSLGESLPEPSTKDARTLNEGCRREAATNFPSSTFNLSSRNARAPGPSGSQLPVAPKPREGGSSLNSQLLCSPMAIVTLNSALVAIRGRVGDVVAIDALRSRGAGDCRVIVKAHRESDEAIFDLLERSRVWVEHGKVSLEIAKI